MLYRPAELRRLAVELGELYRDESKVIDLYVDKVLTRQKEYVDYLERHIEDRLRTELVREANNIAKYYAEMNEQVPEGVVVSASVTFTYSDISDLFRKFRSDWYNLGLKAPLMRLADVTNGSFDISQYDLYYNLFSSVVALYKNKLESMNYRCILNKSQTEIILRVETKELWYE